MRLAISQRVEVVASYGERRDALDQAWHPLLAQIGAVGLPVPNTPANLPAWLNAVQPQGLVLTGGNDLADLPDASNPALERDATERALLEYASQHQLPVLAVCRGAQLMNVFLGGRLMPVSGHVARRHALRLTDESPLFTGLNEVNSFHAWGIGQQDLAKSCRVAALADDGSVEAYTHQSLPWIGVLWHPEREQEPYCPQDLTVLRHLFGK